MPRRVNIRTHSPGIQTPSIRISILADEVATPDGVIIGWSGRLATSACGPVRTRMVFSPDSKTLAGSNEDYTVQLWDFGTGEQKGTLTGHTNTRSESVAVQPGRKDARQ